jgi:hypothetical protein
MQEQADSIASRAPRSSNFAFLEPEKGVAAHARPSIVRETTEP